MIRILCLLIAILTFAAPAQATALRVRGHINGVVVPNPPPPFDQTVTIRGTQTLDMSTSISSVISSTTATELIGLKYVGPIKAAIWQYPDCGAGNTCTFVKRELSSFMTAQTNGATDGTAAGSWTLTGSFGTYVYAFDVATPEITDCNYGALTAIRYGGCPLYNLTSDPVAADWSVSSAAGSCGAVACNTLWEIWNQRLIIKCVGNTTQCPVNNTGTNYTNSGATTAIATGSRTGSTTVLLNNSAGHGDRTITINWIANQWNVAPQPTWAGFPTQMGGSQICGQLQASMTLRDRIKIEATAEHPQTYAITSGTTNCGGSAGRTIAAGGHTFPTFPAGWGNGTNDADWIVASCGELWACRVDGFALKHDLWTGNDAALKPGYLRLSGLDMRGTNGGVWDTDLGGSGTQIASYMQYDHSYIIGHQTPLNGQRQKDIFLTDNWDIVDPTGTFLPGQVALNGCDNIISGNRFDNADIGDVIHHAIWQCTLGGTKAEVAWNSEFGTSALGSNTHTDSSQGVWSTTPSITAQDNSGPRSFGNAFLPAGLNGITKPVGLHVYDCWDHYLSGTKGDYSNGVGTCQGTVNTRFLAKGVDAWGTSADIGVKITPPYQGLFEGNIPGTFGEVAVSHSWVGNLIVTDYVQAASGLWASPGSVARYNTLANISISHGTYFAFGNGAPFINIAGLGAQMTMEGNIAAGSIGAGVSTFTAPTPSFGFGNIAVADGSQYTDPTHTGSTAGKSLLLLQTWLDMYAPTGAATCGGHVCGAVGNGKIDIRSRQVLDPTIFDTTAGALPPRCTNQGVFDLTHNGDGKTVGNQFTTGTAATFTNSPSTVTHNWFRQIQTGAITLVSANAANYVLGTSDFSAGSTVKIFEVDYGTNADGTGPCISATFFQIKP